MINKKTFYSLIMDNRAFIMSFAIIWVMFSHTPIGTYNIPVISFVSKIGWGGVDVFMLISGIGIYTSLFRCNNDIIPFYKRRLKRIMPSYIVVLVIAFITYLFMPADSRYAVGHVNFQYIADFIGNITCITFFMGRRKLNWYVQGIVWMYFLSPIVYVIVNRCNNITKKILLFVTIVIFNVPLYYSDMMTVSARWVLYVLGMFIAKQALQDGGFRVTKKIYLLLSLLSCLGFASLYLICKYREPWLNLYGLYFYPFVMIVPGLVCNIAMLNELIRKSIFSRIFSWIGRYTFEIYLMNIYITSCWNYKLVIPNRFCTIPLIDQILQYCSLMVMAIILGYILHEFSGLPSRLIKECGRNARKAKD